MTQTDIPNRQNNIPLNGNQGQNNDPYLQQQDLTGQQYPQPVAPNGQNQWQVQQPNQYPVPMQTDIPQQQPTPISPSAEVPARLESQEGVVFPEISVEGERNKEQSERTSEQSKKKETNLKAPEKEPEQQRFESPFRVYGYQASPNITCLGDNLRSTKVRGNTHDAKTWLFVLLSRLLRVYKGEAYST